MRIHRLELQAFGPFAHRQEVDFDRLGAHGLFLLNGPTGAGKSSVLDAICYALYGSVTGARQGAKRLRSDHAPESLAPEVACEFSVGGRRLEVIRNPQWNRPAKRGTGTTSEPARTLLREKIDGEWVQKSARNDEAGGEIQALLGMDREQFTRVVMLPQGEFAAFLRSDAKSRRDLLQKLFATDRFEKVEQVLTERARTMAGRVAEAEAGLSHIHRRAVDEVQRYESADDAVPDATGDAGAPLTLTDLRARLATVLESARRTSDADSRNRSLLTQQQQDTLAAYTRRQALAAFRAVEEAHAAQREEAADFQTAVDRDRKARILESGLRALDLAEDALRQTTERAQSATRMVAGSPVATSLLPDLESTGQEKALPGTADTIAMLDAACTAATSELGVLRAALPEEQRLQSLEERLTESATELQRIDAALRECAEALAEVRAETALVGGERVELERTVNGTSALDERVAEGKRLLATIAALDTARTRMTSEEDRYSAAERRFLELKSIWLETLRQRLEQAAAELAAGLTEDSDCPVCGSRSHPHPASADGASLVTHEQEQAARQDQLAAEQVVERLRRVRDDAVLDAARLQAQGGDREVGAVREALEADTALLAEAVAAGKALERATERLTALAGREETLTAQHNGLATAQAETRASITGLQEQMDEMQERLATLRGGYETLAERTGDLAAAHETMADCRDALQDLARAGSSRELAFATLSEALVGSAFDHPDEVRSALLSPVELDHAELFLATHHRAGDRLEADRALPDIAGALRDEAAGLPIVTSVQVDDAAASEAEAAERATASLLRLRMVQESVLQLDRYATELTRQEQVVLPLLQERDLIKSLADTAAGGGENSFKMSLGTYVLAARLEQVADAATERLLAMSDGRYALVHSDALSGNRKSGLGLNVIDGWTGNRRDTATLSGGESFMAALALALGLADVVQAESGGIEIETLFVDEGFGSLDEQSLEQVMDALEGLRDGGRMVGLVSHVAELKQRIGAQLQVVKERDGSTLHIVDQVPAQADPSVVLQTV
ncbi:exonuclease SbcC [Arthrobacter sp. CAN_A212]|uniref:AAA family ATPase n=1 Tax=Arthrobacter sp. CAN_A212 TaxID=2787719 RepID=UPI0018CA102A